MTGLVQVGEVGQRHWERTGTPVDAVAAVLAPVAVDLESAVRGGTKQAGSMGCVRAGAHGRGESATTCEPERGDQRQHGAGTEGDEPVAIPAQVRIENLCPVPPLPRWSAPLLT